LSAVRIVGAEMMLVSSSLPRAVMMPWMTGTVTRFPSWSMTSIMRPRIAAVKSGRPGPFGSAMPPGSIGLTPVALPVSSRVSSPSSV
jgi:hypothetical protein